MIDAGAMLIAVALLIGNAFFVGAEFALIAARRTQIEPRATAGSRPARLTLRAMERVSLMMAGAQLGITMCSLGLGAIGEPAVAHALEIPLAAIGVTGAGAALDRVRHRARHRGLPPHGARRDGPEEHRDRRTRAVRAHPRPDPLRGRTRAAPPHRVPELGGQRGPPDAPGGAEGRGGLRLHCGRGGRLHRGVPRGGPPGGPRAPVARRIAVVSAR